MIRSLGFSVAAIFLGLSLLHLYWAAGGKFGGAVAVPNSSTGERLFNPSPAGTILVAIACFIAMLVILGRVGSLGNRLPEWFFRWGSLGIAAVFFLRAVGDFKYMGFFKRVNETGFAFWDTVLFSPLCLFIAVAAFLIGFFESEV